MDHPAVVLHLTLDQRDQLDRLLRTLIAHGDVIAMSKPECLEAQTLPTLGQAIFDAANAVREMLEQRAEQRPGRSYLHAEDDG
ncbi:hypothetical protein [Xanthomonas campestris]|uniref:hypothetical protein n=1 Tax=Xanthomonas campestris TaxID=339 RepID=UPI001F4442C9|nr:hypothetical protein [Xanthomonas campestris]MCF8795324.1 hypothetical protein [Xanthomonas campestris pv. campestris]MCF8815942.1 hypothetical protein [Xanthomonas campestris pv. campestris]WHO88942.1 hypothetical protein QMY63_01240 [Xanthomonas campestris]